MSDSRKEPELPAAAGRWRQRLRAQGLWVLPAILLAMLLSCLPVADTVGQAHVDSAFKRALVGYALARGLNGVISVAQGTEIAVQPAGVGLNFTPGEILDPINDLVERFSWIMLLASSSLGVQKVLLSMSAWNGLLLAVVVLGLVLCASLLLSRLQRLRPVMQRLFLFMLLLRFMMPAISVANDWVYRTFLEADYVAASASLNEAQQAIGRINDEVLAERSQVPRTMLERARDLYDSAMASVDINGRLAQYRQAAESISESTIRLVVVFLMQTVVFPLVFLFVVLGLLRRVMRSGW